MHKIKDKERRKVPWTYDGKTAVMREEDTCTILNLHVDQPNRIVDALLAFGFVDEEGVFEAQPGRVGKLTLGTEPEPDGTKHFQQLCAFAGGVEKICIDATLEYIARFMPEVGITTQRYPGDVDDSSSAPPLIPSTPPLVPSIPSLLPPTPPLVVGVEIPQKKTAGEE